MDPKQRKRKKEADAKKRAALENRVLAYWKKKHRPDASQGQGSLSAARLNTARMFQISVAEVNAIVRSDLADIERKIQEYDEKMARAKAQEAYLDRIDAMQTVAMQTVPHPFNEGYRGKCQDCALSEFYLVHEQPQVRLV